MKTTILTAAFALTAAFGISRSAHAATGEKTEVSTVLSGVSKISEIEVHGNVQLYLTTANEEKVKVYNNYYAQDGLVQEENGILRITSYTGEKLVVWVTVNNLSKLSVFDNAKVTSFGQFSAIDLEVNLYNHAVAQFKMETFNASITLNDRTAGELSGVTENGTLRYARSSWFDVSDFVGSHLTETMLSNPARHFHKAEFAAL